MTSQKSGAYLSDPNPNVKLFFSLFSSFCTTARFYWEKILLFFAPPPAKDSKDPRDLKDLSGRRIRAAAKIPNNEAALAFSKNPIIMARFYLSFAPLATVERGRG